MKRVYRACLGLVLTTLVQTLLMHTVLAQGAAPRKMLSLDDLFQTSVLMKAAVSPDGEWIAATVLRPAGSDDVYGRTFYEMDVTRADIWLISRRTGERRNITQGAADAAGFWCATWSPDGNRLAMMSTKPEGSEPRGGNNARLYVWEREGERLTRLTSRGLSSQTLGGSAMSRVDLRGPQQVNGDTARCGETENAPFLWLTSTSVLAVVLPEGGVSAIVDAYSRGLEHASATRDRLRVGKTPTFTVSESGVPQPPSPLVSLQIIDATSGAAQDLGSVPAHPFEGNLQVSVAPDGRGAAVLASKAAIPMKEGEKFAYPFSSWGVEKQLGFVDFAPGATIRWASAIPADGRYLLDLAPWLDDGSSVAVRARPNASTRALTLLMASRRDLSVSRASPTTLSVAASMAAADAPDESAALSAGDVLVMRAVAPADELAPFDWYVRKRQGKALPRVDWWAFSRTHAPVNLTTSMPEVPSSWRASNAKGRWVGIAGGHLWSLDARSRRTTRLTDQPLLAGAEIVWPNALEGASKASSVLIVAGTEKDGVRPLVRVTLGKSKATVEPVTLPSATAQFEDYIPSQSQVLFRDLSPQGVFLWGGSTRLLALNEHMANIDPGKVQMIDYRGVDGQSLKGAAILPPDYQPGKRYPVLMWVYAGATVRGPSDRSLGLYMPGEYNLRLYAARGYVVLMPTMPLARDGGKNDHYIDLPKGAMPAVDKLIELGIADPDRLAVMGQSYGGYSVYSLVTYTPRFKAAIAMAGLTDLVSIYGEFDRTARGYDGIEHQKSVNWGLAEQGQISMSVPPWEDQWRYWRNSPINYVDRVQTPLLMIHGEQDIRGGLGQAEEFFFALYRQGKRAKLLRYWGEDHGLRQSPANVRDIVNQIFEWLQINMPEKKS